MRRLIWLVGCAVPVWLGAQTAPDTPLITLGIVDPEGRPVPHARVMATMNLRGENYQERVTDPAWQRVSPRGLCVIDGDVSSRLYAKAALQGKQAVRFSAWIHAAGYRPVHVHHEGVLPREATVTLQPARSLEVRLYDAQGNPVDLTPRQRYYTPRYEESPILVVEEQKVSLHDERTLLGESSEVRDSWRRTPLYLGFGIEKIEPGRYRVELPTQIDGKLYLAIHQRGLIRG
ncbi:MAG: hypothetical protein NZ556_09270, partial [Fimbriimonadales bacterium]|nr:hypothetical protein [Fimbriimonadales bacterium]